MRYISTFSGIEAASAAWGPLGWEPVAFSEIERFPCAVLAHRFPDVPNLGDITKVDWSRYRGAVDVVVGGSPCQSFSVAGKREGLAGASGLMWEYVRCVREVLPRWFVWENVPGALSSSHGEDFRCLLDAMGELGYGLAWRVLDAQFFRVAQRRRRVFLIGSLGDRSSADVLFEPECVPWCPEPSKKKREELARAAGRGVVACGGAGVVASGFCGYASHTASSIGYQDEQAPTLKGNDWQNQVPVVLKFVAQRMATTQYGDEVAGTLTARHDSSPCADRGQNIVCMASGQGNAEVTSDGTSPTITCLHEKPIVCVPHSHVLKVRQGKPGGGKGALVGTEVSFTLATSQDQTLIQMVEPHREPMAIDARNSRSTAGLSGTLQAKENGGYSLNYQNPVAYEDSEDAMAVTIHDGSRWVVRRLTPVECERLQGFPDGWTDVPYKGKDHPQDGPRYKAIGNSMAVPVMRWIGERIDVGSSE